VLRPLVSKPSGLLPVRAAGTALAIGPVHPSGCGAAVRRRSPPRRSSCRGSRTRPSGRTRRWPRVNACDGRRRSAGGLEGPRRSRVSGELGEALRGGGYRPDGERVTWPSALNSTPDASMTRWIAAAWAIVRGRSPPERSARSIASPHGLAHKYCEALCSTKMCIGPQLFASLWCLSLDQAVFAPTLRER